MNADPRVSRLVRRWRELYELGRAPAVEELCADCPELSETVGRQIQAFASRESPASHSAQAAAPPEDDEDDAHQTARFAAGGDADDPDATNVPESFRTPAERDPPPTVIKPDPHGSRVIRGYRLIERLGGGTYGVVYRALSPGGVEVAVKEITYAVDHPQSRRELEALELIKGLRHPYILSLHDFWVENNRLYMAMELADATLAQRGAAKSGGMTAAEALPIFAEAAEALDFLHQQHVLHRDVKPANILLLRGHAKVADLGLAKFNPDEVAVSQNVAGSPAYMAPESFRNEFRAEGDQYALALCYAEMRLGRSLCEGMNVPAVIAWHLYGTPDLTGLEPHEEKAVRRALCKDPAKRFPSCRDFVRALEPPRPRQRGGAAWWIVAALAAAAAVAALVAWRLWPAPGVRHTAPPPPQVGFVPEEHGFATPSDAQIRLVAGVPFYDRMVKKVGGRDVVFVLIPRLRDDEPQTFYMMQDKVSNALFKAAGNDPDFQNRLGKAQQEFPALKWDEWEQGGVRNGAQPVGCADDLPVLRVNVMEADCFARWLGGKLPTLHQWDRAAGKGEGAKEVFRDPDVPLAPGDVAVDRRAEGPMPVGTAKRDVSPLGCRDMAGNGREWTRTLDSDTDESVPPQHSTEFLQVKVRGQAYYNKQPFGLSNDVGYSAFRQGDPSVGFRVVVEP